MGHDAAHETDSHNRNQGALGSSATALPHGPLRSAGSAGHS
jgi:hypothetical protein